MWYGSFVAECTHFDVTQLASFLIGSILVARSSLSEAGWERPQSLACFRLPSNSVTIVTILDYSIGVALFDQGMNEGGGYWVYWDQGLG